jgi:hypothetical protein
VFRKLDEFEACDKISTDFFFENFKFVAFRDCEGNSTFSLLSLTCLDSMSHGPVSLLFVKVLLS